jgi:segregation and condensation protein B
MDVKKKIEAVLFVSAEAVSVQKLAEITGESKEAVEQAAVELEKDYENRAVMISKVAGGFQLLTRPEYADIIRAFIKQISKRKLSQAAMETLSIIAYKQPIKRQEIEGIRGVSSGEIIKALLEAELIKITGRENSPGQPMLYGTTDRFLEICGINSTNDLPKPSEIEEAINQ